MDDININFNWCKVAVVGSIATGKSTIIKSFYNNEFTDCRIPTVAVDYCFKTVKLNDTEARLTIFDFSGDTQYYDCRTELYKDSDAVLFVFDLNNETSFSNIDNWLDEVNCHIDKRTKNLAKVQEQQQKQRPDYYLIGNKYDILSEDKEYDQQKYMNYCKSNNINGSYYEISSKTMKNINNLFNNIVSNILIRRKIF